MNISNVEHILKCNFIHSFVIETVTQQRSEIPNIKMSQTKCNETENKIEIEFSPNIDMSLT